MSRRFRFAKRARLNGLRQTIGTAVAVWGIGCATVEPPPGGPPDFTPPALVSVRPDSGAVLDRFDGAAEFRFDEVITEPTGQTADRLFLLSPRAQALNVDWKRTRLTVKPKEGWRQGVVYRLTLYPQVTDLRSNRLESGRVIVFAIGRPIPDTRITGSVVDWEAGRTARSALVEAVALPDSTVYFTQADSAGSFDLTAVPPGTYALFGTVDANGNRIRDRGEAFDSTTVALDSLLTHDFWAFRQDTVGPQILNVARADSLTIRVELSQSLAPGPIDPSAAALFALPDTTPVAVAAVWREGEYDSLRALEGERARAAADSARAAADTTRADTAAVRPQPTPRPDTTTTPPDSAQAGILQLLRQRPTLSDRFFIRLVDPLTSGGRFLVAATVSNVLGHRAESRALLIVPGGESEP